MASVGQRSTQHFNLPLHHLPVRPSDGASGLHTVFEVKYLLHVFVKLVTERLEVLKRELRQRALARLRESDGASRDMVRLSEGDLGQCQQGRRVDSGLIDTYPLAHQVVCQIRGKHIRTLLQSSGHCGLIDLGAASTSRCHTQ